jgi:hypothetical protein
MKKEMFDENKKFFDPHSFTNCVIQNQICNKTNMNINPKIQKWFNYHC